MAEQALDRQRLKAVLFDLDGTLYRQDALRRAMLLRLVRAHVRRPLRGLRTMRALSAYRAAQEHLRAAGAACTPHADLAHAQLRLACERSRATPEFVAACVRRWMEEEPLDLVQRTIQPGLMAFVHAARARGVRLGVLSDYPAQAKLEVLGLEGLLEVVLTAQSPDVGVFKPHPRGLQVALERLGLSASECVYVGDRAEVDGAAAAAVGMPCFILTGRRGAPSAPQPWVQVADFRHLQALVLGS